MFLTFCCCFGSGVRGRLGIGLCVYSERPFWKTWLLRTLFSFIGSVVIIVVLSKSKLCPLWEVCAYTNDVSSCRRIVA